MMAQFGHWKHLCDVGFIEEPETRHHSRGRRRSGPQCHDGNPASTNGNEFIITSRARCWVVTGDISFETLRVSSKIPSGLLTLCNRIPLYCYHIIQKVLVVFSEQWSLWRDNQGFHAGPKWRPLLNTDSDMLLEDSFSHHGRCLISPSTSLPL